MAATWASHRESQLKADPAGVCRDQQSQAGAVHRCDSRIRPERTRSRLSPFTGCFRATPAGQRELNDPRVQQAIHQQLHDNQKQLLQTAYLETLQDDARVRNYLAEEILKKGAQ